jgi:putative ABC transport system permease protein
MEQPKKIPHDRPPRLADALLELLFNTYEVEEIQGDLAELFGRRTEDYGLRQARRLYWLDVLRFLNPFSRKRKIRHPYPTSPPLAMLHNYLLTAFREARRNKLFTGINLTGLGTGLAAFLVIVQFVLFEKSYDTFNQNAGHIYRVPFSWEPLSRGNTGELYASNVPAFGPALANDFPEVAAYTRMFHIHTIVPYCVLTYVNKSGNKVSFNESKGYYAEPAFLSMFSFPLTEGDKASALREPKAIVLTKSAATRYFGRENPVGKKLDIQNEGPSGTYTVTGILEDVPRNSHLQFDFLLSYASLGTGSVQKSWVWSQFYTYVQLRPGTNPKALEAKLPAFLKKYNGEKCEYEVFLQPLQSIHLTSHLRFETSVNGSERTVNFLLIMAGLILVIAWVNYVNLSSARALERARETGVRKAIGAGRPALFAQFLVQAFLANGMALLLAMVLTIVAIPLYVSRVTGGIIDFSLFVRPSFWLLALGAWIVGSLLSGLYPAMLLSSYKPVEALKGKIRHTAGGLYTRKLLATTQFVASIALAIFTGVVLAQFYFMRNQDLGIRLEQTLVLRTPGATEPGSGGSLDYFRQEVTKSAAVQGVTFSSAIPGREITTTRGMKRRNGEPKGNTNFFLVGVDEKYIPYFGLELLAGRGFSENFAATDKGRSVVLNEQALKVLGLESPEGAIGEKVLLNGRPPELTITGVIKDYHNKSLEHPIEPIVMYPDSLGEGYLSVRIQVKDNLPVTLSAVEKAYGKAFPGQPLDYFFLNEFFNQQYQQEARNVEVFTFFAVLAILIACLGLIGLTTYAIAGRTKEIGVRKVHGADTFAVARLLLKDLMLTVLIANLMAWPLSWWVVRFWLEHYAFRLPLSPVYFLVPGAAVSVIALLSVLYQTLKAARTRPAAFLTEG